MIFNKKNYIKLGAVCAISLGVSGCDTVASVKSERVIKVDGVYYETRTMYYPSSEQDRGEYDEVRIGVDWVDCYGGCAQTVRNTVKAKPKTKAKPTKKPMPASPAGLPESPGGGGC